MFYGILTGFYWLLVVASNLVVVFVPSILEKRHYRFDRQYAEFMNSLIPKYRPLIRIEGLLAIGLHVLIVWSFGIPLLSYLAIYFIFGLAWSSMQYVHHYGTERHVLHGSINLKLFEPVDVIWLHHNWHREHHENPTVPWIYLPKLNPDNPRRGLLLWHYLRMWRGPRLTTERVKNRYAGRLIR
jgi:fatty acid desaturase